MRTALAALALAGCLRDEYLCASDAECDVGMNGRCEADHHCTEYDAACPLDRRYTPHSGAMSGACFADNVVPLDPCAAGQPPTLATDNCGALVCAAEPTCCTTAWTEACVQQAQLHCAIRCDTRLAVYAAHGATVTPFGIELYDVRFDGATWSVATHTTDRSQLIAWLAPAPGAAEPRLATISMAGDALLVGDAEPTAIAIATDRKFDAVASVDFERSGRDTAMIASYTAVDQLTHALLDLTNGGERDLMTSQAAAIETWGDYDGDPYPDAVGAGPPDNAYRFLQSVDDSSHVRQFSDVVTATTPSGEFPQVRSFSWADLDRNGRVDLIEVGSQIQIHAGVGITALANVPSTRIDCDPPQQFILGASCAKPATSAWDQVSFAATTLAFGDHTAIAASVDNYTLDATGNKTNRSRNLHVLAPPAFADQALAFEAPCPAGTINCPPLRAVVARDVDGDGVLDLIAVDSTLEMYVAMGKPDGTFAAVHDLMRLPTMTPPSSFFQMIRVSVSGALR
jgi:hypothetical protein